MLFLSGLFINYLVPLSLKVLRVPCNTVVFVRPSSVLSK